MFNSVELINFRNIESQKINFSSSVNILIGQNGQGKTNILEAINICGSGNTFRFCSVSDLIRKDSEQAYIKASIRDSSDNAFEESILIKDGKKEIKLDGKPVSSNSLAKKFKPVLFSPESLSVIKEGTELRRNLVDELILSVSPHLSSAISEYKKVLRTRNRLLSDFKKEITAKDRTISLLSSINPLFFVAAEKLSLVRLGAISSVLEAFNLAAQNILSDGNVEILVDYVISGQKINANAGENVRELIEKRAIELQSAELSYGTSLVGPHKHDVTFLYNGNDSRIFCSQGQQRALILAFKIAQIVYHHKSHGKYPVLLLDDVMSELDEQKRNALVKYLGDFKTQMFMTTTDVHMSEIMGVQNSQVMKVVEGKIV